MRLELNNQTRYGSTPMWGVFRIVLTLFCTCWFGSKMTSPVLANPSDGNVVAGAADINSAGSTLTVNQHTDKAIINWGGFSIDQNELTQFLQPSQTSAILNRVTGGNLSAIHGQLKANGQVFLINPSGIVVGSIPIARTRD